MEINDEFLAKQTELYEAIGIELLKVTPPEHWQDIRCRIMHVPVDTESYSLEFDISSPEGHTDMAAMNQELVDSAIVFYNYCHSCNQEWKEVIIRIYIDKNDKWKCEAKYRYE